MFKKFLLISFLVFGTILTTYPSKKENTYFFEYCYSLEKIISRNSFDKSTNLLKDFNPYLKDISSLGTNKTRGSFVNKIIDQYKTLKKSNFITFVPNKFYCFAGYWIETVNPGTFQSAIYKKSKQKINQYNNTKKDIDKFIENINLDYKSIKKEINDFF